MISMDKLLDSMYLDSKTRNCDIAKRCESICDNGNVIFLMCLYGRMWMVNPH